MPAAARTAAHKKRNGATPLGRRIETLREDIETLQDNMRTLVTDAGGAANEGVNEAVRATEFAAQQVLEEVEEWADDNVNSLRDQIREQPIAACIVSLAAGALLGALFLRR
jgi:ElaB/YqjD/DUF883 family membrane-anchored ribosome-binding protein